MTLTLPDEPTASLNQLLQVSAALQSLNEDVAAYSKAFGSDYSTTGWTAINSGPSAPFDSNVDSDNAYDKMDDGSETVEEEVYAGGERDMLFTFENEQALAYDAETGVYMKNVQTGSWAGRLRDDEIKDVEIQNLVALYHVCRAQESARAQQRMGEQQIAELAADVRSHRPDNRQRSDPNFDTTEAEGQELERDNAIRSQISVIKTALLDGGVLSLEHSTAEGLSLHECRGCDSYITCPTYYVELQVPALEDSTYTYCLTCFEEMWNSGLLMGRLPDPRLLMKGPDGRTAEEDACVCHGVIAELPQRQGNDGDGDTHMRGGELLTEQQDHFISKRRDSVQWPPTGALSTSKHAPKSGEIAASQLAESSALAKQHNEQSQRIQSALRSATPVQPSDLIIKEHCGRFLPTRFQHLARHIQPGGSLNDVEKNTLAAWKATTRAQFSITSHWFSPPEAKIAAKEWFDASVNPMVKLEDPGHGMRDFYGRDLSEALTMVAARDDA